MERLLNNPDWYEQANCASVGGEIMFPTDRAGVKMAQSVCGGCVVVGDCLTDAMRTEKTYRDFHGIRGGLSAEERKRVAGVENGEESI